MKRTTTSFAKEPGSAIDWRIIRQRLENTREAIEHGFAPSPEEKKQILKARAKALAREAQRSETTEQRTEFVEFRLASEMYGIEFSYVREVYPLRTFTPLVGTPPFVLGIINVRGRILSVIDIKKFFDLPERGLSDLNKVIVLRSGQFEFGLLADVIVGVRKIQLSELQQTLPTLTGIREQYLKGVTKDRVVILDGQKLLSDKMIIVHEQVET